MKEIMKNLGFFSKSIIAALFVVIVGIVLLTKDISNSIGSALLVSGVYTIIDNMFLKNSLINLVIEKVNLDKDIDNSGLLMLDNNLSNIPYRKYFEEANGNIDIVHNYGRTWTTSHLDYIKKCVLEKECNLRVILLNPESPFLDALEKHYKYKKGTLTNYIEEAVATWKSLYEEIERKKKTIKKKNNGYKNKKFGSIKLFYFNGQPTNSIYRIDDKIIVVTAKNSSEKSTFLPYTIYINNGKNGLYQVYYNEIENIIREATEVDFERSDKVEVR